MAIDKDLIREKLKILEEFIRTIEEMSFTASEMLEVKDIQHLVAFRLQQSVETAIDIANHLASTLPLPQRDTAADVFLLLGQEKIIPRAVANKMKGACGFRNLVVHHYGQIDFRKLYRDYKDDLEDLRNFAKAVFRFLGKQTR